MIYKDISVTTDYINGQRVPSSFQTTPDAPPCIVECINPIIYYVNKGRTEFKCCLSNGERVVIILVTENNTEHWLVDMLWNTTKSPKRKSGKSAEQIKEELKQLRKKSEVNDKTVFGAAAATAAFGVLFFFACFIAKTPHTSSALNETFKVTTLKAVLNIATAFGFVLFGTFLIGELIVKLFYHIAERKLNNGIITETRNTENDWS